MTGLRSHTSADRIVLERRTKDGGWLEVTSSDYSNAWRWVYLEFKRDWSDVSPKSEYRVVRRTVRVTDEVIA